MTDFNKITRQILSVPGWTLTRLGDEVGLAHTSIIRLRDGITIDPHYTVGVRLIAIHRRLRQKIGRAA